VRTTAGTLTSRTGTVGSTAEPLRASAGTVATTAGTVSATAEPVGTLPAVIVPNGDGTGRGGGETKGARKAVRVIFTGATTLLA
jgi:hypothetical protein